MRQIYFALSLILVSLSVNAQSTMDLTLQVTTTVQKDPALIHFDWKEDLGALTYQVYRKSPEALSWGTVLATLDPDMLSWEDANVELGKKYEYRFIKTANSYFGYTYVLAGIEVPAIEQRGMILLVVEDTYWAEIEAKIERLKLDLIGDGWQVKTVFVNRTESVPSVKTKIKAVYAANSSSLKSVFLFGRVPVPYSGNLNPDGHPDHQGAWPADVFYADMDGSWSDDFINNTVASRPENDNVIGDGKFDTSLLPSDIELEIGRVDMANMPAFGAEADLLNAYLDKDHAYRHHQIVVSKTGIVDDNFGTFNGEAFAASGWRALGMLQSPDSVSNQDYRDYLNAEGAQWAYGCGGGTYTSAGGVGNSSQFATDSLKGIFSMLFGSYFGDWDCENNFLRAPLANKGTILTNAWSGRPHWHFHTMALGNTIGQAARLTQNNNNTYFTNYGGRFIHIALMGDPTLRQDILEPPVNLTIIAENNEAKNRLTWNKSGDEETGFYVYRSDSLNGPYTRLTQDIINDTEYLDDCPAIGDNYYMVRAAKLTVSNSGSYYNLSQGILGNQINTGSFLAGPVPGNPLCAGAFYDIPFLVQGPDCPDNQVIAYLSDQNGVFQDPAPVIGNQLSSFSNFLQILIPDNLPNGENYKIRIETNKPGHIKTFGNSLTILGKVDASFTWEIVNQQIQFLNTSINATEYHWIFDDGAQSTLVNPIIDIPTPGTHIVTLVASNACNMETIQVEVIISNTKNQQIESLKIIPNPVGKSGLFRLNLPENLNAEVSIFSQTGQHLKTWVHVQKDELDISDLLPGHYVLKIRSDSKIWNSQLVKLE